MLSYEQRVARMLSDLGVAPTYGADRGMPLCHEATTLVSIGLDVHGREQRLTPNAAERWLALRSAADRDGVSVLLVSAFRSLDYQKQIWDRKLAASQTVEQILQVNAAPGYSEHHTGRAVDVTTPGIEPLTEDFERTPAFAWLMEHARQFRFILTYPRDNRFGIAYEPWHWALEVSVG
jgi:D-alanyl-D-alanine carboxypeptidase